MTIVDAHHHLWDLAVRDQDWMTSDALALLRRDFSLADLRPLAREAGVGATVVVQTVSVAAETSELLALAATDDLVAGVVGWTDLTAPDIADTLAALRELPGGEKLVGIRHQVESEPDPYWLLRPEVYRGLAAVADAGLVYDLLVRPRQLAAATAAAARTPGLTFVLDHLAKPPVASAELEPWAAEILGLTALPNTVCKLSGLVTEADWEHWTTADLRPFTDTVLETFGPQRLMFGSDWPVCTLAAPYAEVLDAARLLTDGLSTAERQAVFTQTATRTYRLTLPAG